MAAKYFSVKPARFSLEYYFPWKKPNLKKTLTINMFISSSKTGSWLD
ncbi:DUF1493 family protein [Erwinia billingiae]|nr:DUF1493 family protein [Erwinia billingiae]